MFQETWHWGGTPKFLSFFPCSSQNNFQFFPMRYYYFQLPCTAHFLFGYPFLPSQEKMHIAGRKGVPCLHYANPGSCCFFLVWFLVAGGCKEDPWNVGCGLFSQGMPEAWLSGSIQLLIQDSSEWPLVISSLPSS